jgi:tRNA(Arg) A34 adenosine deaminase TadA
METSSAKAKALDIARTDTARMDEVIRFTARTLLTNSPVPFGALIVDTKTGAPLVKAVNSVRKENDPSCHAELRTVRLACKKLKSPSLRGYTMYSTCEPCPMCMANLLWAGIDRIVYGATIADANKHCRQIRVPAAEVARRSDMQCIVDGPLQRASANTLFDHPNMQRVFKLWGGGTAAKKTAAKKRGKA